MSAHPPRIAGGRPPASVQAGAALITALVIAALAAATILSIVTAQQRRIDGVSRLVAEGRAAHALAVAEVAAIHLLREDVRRTRHDSLDEAWATATESPQGAALRLRDAQSKFNLNDIVPGARTRTARRPAATSAAVRELTLSGAGESARTLFVRDDRASAVATSDLAGAQALGRSLRAAAGGATASDPATARAIDAAADSVDLAPHEIALARFHLLLKALDIPADIVPAILDWLDEDGEPRYPNGAEDDYYSRLDPPYRAANRRLLDISELRLVKGVTEEIVSRLEPHVSTQPFDTPVNINTASVEVLMSLAPGIDRARAETIARLRAIQPFRAVGALTSSPQIGALPMTSVGLAVRSELFEADLQTTVDERPVRENVLIARTGPDRIAVVRRERLGW